MRRERNTSVKARRRRRGIFGSITLEERRREREKTPGEDNDRERDQSSDSRGARKTRAQNDRDGEVGYPRSGAEQRDLSASELLASPNIEGAHRVQGVGGRLPSRAGQGGHTLRKFFHPAVI